MLETLKNAFRIKEIRKKLFFTFCMIVVIRFGSQLPVVGVNRDYFSQWFSQQSNDAFSFFSAFTGGSFERMSIFALNVISAAFHETTFATSNVAFNSSRLLYMIRLILLCFRFIKFSFLTFCIKSFYIKFYNSHFNNNYSADI